MTSRALDEGMARIANLPPEQQRKYMFSRVLIRENIGTEKHRLEEIDGLVLTEGKLFDSLRSSEWYFNFMCENNITALPSLPEKCRLSSKKVEAVLKEVRDRITWNLEREINYKEKLVALANDLTELLEYRMAASRILSYIEKSTACPDPYRNKPCSCGSGLDYKKCCAMDVE